MSAEQRRVPAWSRAEERKRAHESGQGHRPEPETAGQTVGSLASLLLGREPPPRLAGHSRLPPTMHPVDVGWLKAFFTSTLDELGFTGATSISTERRAVKRFGVGLISDAECQRNW